MKSNKVLFFSNGDSNDPSVWSNVPYCFSNTLEKRGYKLVRINLGSPKFMVALWDKTVYRVLRSWKHGHQYGFERTLIASIYRKIAIWIANRNHSDIFFSVFTSFDDINYFSDRPSLLLCDWTLEYFIKYRLRRQPYWLEKCFISRQNKILRSADYVVSLFPRCKDVIEEMVPGTTVQYLGGNVLNILDYSNLDGADIVEQKKQSNLILFIGNTRYKSGACKLIKAYRLLAKKRADLHLAIVGMTAEDLGVDGTECIDCYGYLHKDVVSENQTYYSLLRTAKVIVNTNEEWAGFSSMIEAMYYYTPVIVTPYGEFVATFGSHIGFGFYDSTGTVDSLVSCLNFLLNSQYSTYAQMCKNAHEVTMGFTWEHYVDTLLSLVDNGSCKEQS